MKKIFKHLLLTFTSLLIIVGCAKHQRGYVSLDNASSPTEKQQYLLNKTQEYIQNKNLAAAQQTFEQVDIQQLPPQQQVLALMTEARIDLLNQKPKQAIQVLQQAEASNVLLDQTTLTHLQTLFAEAYFANNNVLAGLTMGTRAWHHMPKSQQKSYLTDLWKKLLALNSQRLDSLNTQTENEVQRGWIDLTLITKETTSTEKMLQQLKQWQQQYPEHPAEMLLADMSNRRQRLPNLPNKIAILLPLNGAIGKQGQAIRNGFLAAYYQSKSSGYKPKIAVYDTSQDDINTLYQKATQEQADIVIGPLLKSNIENLIIKQRLTVPTIALNTVPTANPIPNLFQFGLSPENEAQQVAKRIWNDQHQRILIIEPKNPWGQRIQTSFMKTWQQLGGTIVASLDYQSRNKLSQQLRQLLNLDGSSERAKQLKHAIYKKLRFIPRRRQDFDAIFLVATPSMGRQILPLLRFYYANDVPVYSISEIYRGHPNQRLDRDLNGIIFDDMPWLHANQTSLPTTIQAVHHSIEATWPTSFKKYPRFYALGNDAFRLIPEFNKFYLLPNFGMNSATGVLYLQPNGQIYRQLIFSQMKNGKPQVLHS